MKQEKPNYLILHARMHGEFIGTLKGILEWEIPDKLREKIILKLQELEA